MTEPNNRRFTISISVPAAWHFGIGIALAVIAVTAFLIHVELPTGSPYTGDSLAVGIVASGGTLTYWLWCCIQRLRAENRGLAKDAEAAEAAAEQRATAAKEREEQILRTLEDTVSSLASIAEGLAQNGGSIKELTDAMDEHTRAVTALTDSASDVQKLLAMLNGNVVALQNAYLTEGRLLLFPETSQEEVPRDIVLEATNKARTETGPGLVAASARRQYLPANMYAPGVP
jgi:hypothetical protein